ncbi:hypothetical protein Bbelb_036220 [Branchiostoma belcheri]|nr:hypothetical protein Bbelb_036220 [Branchiostoma belcheri]
MADEWGTSGVHQSGYYYQFQPLVTSIPLPSYRDYSSTIPSADLPPPMQQAKHHPTEGVAGANTTNRNDLNVWYKRIEFVKEVGIRKQPKQGRQLKACHLRFLDKRNDDKIAVLQQLIDGKLEYGLIPDPNYEAQQRAFQTWGRNQALNRLEKVWTDEAHPMFERKEARAKREVYGEFERGKRRRQGSRATLCESTSDACCHYTEPAPTEPVAQSPKSGFPRGWTAVRMDLTLTTLSKLDKLQ